MFLESVDNANENKRKKFTFFHTCIGITPSPSGRVSGFPNKFHGAKERGRGTLNRNSSSRAWRIWWRASRLEIALRTVWRIKRKREEREKKRKRKKTKKKKKKKGERGRNKKRERISRRPGRSAFSPSGSECRWHCPGAPMGFAAKPEALMSRRGPRMFSTLSRRLLSWPAAHSRP